MSKTILTIDEYRSLETRAGNMLGHDALMLRAGTAAADFIAERIPAGGRVTLLVGPGNNGGDALVAALELKKRGFATTVVLPGGRQPKSELAKRFFAEWCEAGGAVTDDPYLTEKADCVVDGLFGMGQTKPVAGDDLDAVLWFNERRGLKVSLDVPTGLNPYTGRWIGPRPGCRADATLTFLATKAGFYMEEGVDAAGEIHLFELDVSIPLSTLSVVEEDEFPHVLHRRAQNVHKGDFGRLVVTGGARGTFGAAILAARAALTMGAGLVTVDTLAEDIPAFDPLEPALMFAVEKPDYSKFDVTVLGPGLGRSEAARARVKEALETAHALVLDADALNIIAEDLPLQDLLLSRREPTVLTPHAMEAARLLRRDVKDVTVDRVAAARELAVQTGAIVVLKGPGTVTTLRSSRAWINPTGSAMLATAGTGDVLAGMIGAMFAQKFDMVEATLSAVWLHGRAVEGIEAGVTASSVARLAADLLDRMRQS